jgi:hypothetical protein
MHFILRVYKSVFFNQIRTVIHDINAIVLEHQLIDQYKWTHNPTHSDANDQLVNAQKIWSQFVEKLELNLDRDEKLHHKIKKDMEEVFWYFECLQKF